MGWFGLLGIGSWCIPWSGGPVGGTTLQDAARFLRGACWQLGLCGVVLTGAALAISRLAAERMVHRVNVAWLKLMGGLVVAFLVAEWVLRLVFFHGATFTNNTGPIVQRFAQVYALDQRFKAYRPEVLGPKRADRIRLLIQGDSITFGQGIPQEQAVYPALLLTHLNAQVPGRFEMVVLAQPGREIDGHLQALQEFGRAVAPDVIIYQWHPNDAELDKSLRPVAKRRLWRRLFFHRLLFRTSYAWWFLDMALSDLLQRIPPTYSDYMRQTFTVGTPAWQRFETILRQWADTARHLTPRVIVAFIPMRGTPDFCAQVSHVVAEHGIEVMDFDSYLTDIKRQAWVSRFDSHPSALMHQRMALILSEQLRARYPELFQD